MTEKLDFKRTIGSYRARVGQLEVIDVPDLQYLMVDGHGDPNTDPEFAEAVQALYPVAYAVKFASARGLGRDYVVMPLEGLWRADDLDAYTVARDASRWDWTLMTMVPDWIEGELLTTAVAKVRTKGGRARLDDVRLESLSEGRCVQTLYLGPYADEGPVLERMHHEFIPQHGLRMVGTHHEIYLNDSRTVAPEKLRTILRQPVGPGSASA